MHKIHIISYNTIKSALLLYQDFKQIGIDCCIIENGNLSKHGNKLVDHIKYSENQGYLTTWLNSITDEDLTRYKYITICNSDLRLIGNRFFTDLPYEIGVIGPKIINNGIDIGVFRKSPRNKLRVRFDNLKYINFISFTVLSALVYSLKKLKLFKHNTTDYSGFLECDAVHGSIMTLHWKVIKKLKEYQFKGIIFPFLYGEEDLVKIAAKEIGMSIVYDGSVTFKHIGSESISKLNSYSTYRYLKYANKFLKDESISI